MDTKYLEIIKAPVITEKSTRLSQEENKYVFKVDSKATKDQIKKAVETIFKVKVVDITTINAKVKKRRVGRYTGLTNRYKKAIVKLAEGQSIELN
jgi:large subunit ribosomal protein L23